MIRVLVVEDDPILRTNLQFLLRMEGFEAVLAEDGAQALDSIRKECPDIVLSDVTMPVMDGHELLAALRADPAYAQLPVILLTALADHESMRKGMNIGADDYLTKPFHHDELLDALRSRLARAASQKETTARLEREARRLRHLNTITGLPNRNGFLETLRHALPRLEAMQARLALIIIDLVGFAHINDSIGYSGGNDILRLVAERLRSEINHSVLSSQFDSVAHLEGARFAVTQAEVIDNDHVSGLADRLLRCLAQPIEFNGQEFFLDANAGIALYPDDSPSAEAILEHAETALNEARRGGSGQCIYYSAEMNAAANARLRLNNELHRAIERREFEVYYQPQVSVATGKIVGFEALMRWRSAELGWVSPAQFIPVAEESGMILQIGAWVLDRACEQAREWLDRGATGLRMAVNLSARQFEDGKLCDLIVEALSRTGLPSGQLELEITEGTAMIGAERTIATLNVLKSLGVQLALDDFGTGYSSLSYLKRFPLDVLKVDQSFVRNITTDPGDAAITRAVVSLAKSFGMSVIAEGVETAEHLEFIAGLGCDDFQGYLFSKPLPASEIEVLLGRQFTLQPRE